MEFADALELNLYLSRSQCPARVIFRGDINEKHCINNISAPSDAFKLFDMLGPGFMKTSDNDLVTRESGALSAGVYRFYPLPTG